ncbi:MAG: GNAT family N-acetyltransferase [Clostridiales bacterium]|nr:GNAT family N-acetyltransferase [Clostridiales bacterium]
MKEIRRVSVAGRVHEVVLSDERETLLTAQAAGKAVVGVDGVDCASVHYLVESPETADDAYLERVVRRKLGLPWIIAEGERVRLHEFTREDAKQIPREKTDTEADAVFYTPELLDAYIRGQYVFYECGLWAVERRADGALLGKAGLTWRTEMDGAFLELGYHIFEPFRHQGYAEEACRLILAFAGENYASPVKAIVRRGNVASEMLLKKLGFRRIGWLPDAEEKKETVWVYC